MPYRSNFGIFLLATGSFLGGMALGALLSPKTGRENRRWIANSATELADWVDQKRHDAIRQGEIQAGHIRRNIHKGIKNNVPDLYEATEQIDLDRSELTDG